MRLSDGRVVVANGGTNELRYYDSKGHHLVSVGGEGDGPGEFRRLASVAVLSGDTVAAWDAGNLRLSFFDPTGALARSIALETSEDVRFPQFLGVLDDAMILARASLPYAPGESESTTLRAPAKLLLYGADGSMRDTV